MQLPYRCNHRENLYPYWMSESFTIVLLQTSSWEISWKLVHLNAKADNKDAAHNHQARHDEVFYPSSSKSQLTHTMNLITDSALVVNLQPETPAPLPQRHARVSEHQYTYLLRDEDGITPFVGSSEWSSIPVGLLGGRRPICFI